MTLARIVTLIALLLSAATAAALLLIDPPRACPGWHVGEASTSLWLLLTMWTAPILLFHCFIVVRWDWFVRKATETAGSIPVPVEYVLTRMCIVGAAASQLPLFKVFTCMVRP
jgi:hypothetical protein